MYYKKNIILVPSNYDGKIKGRVVLTFENQNNNLFCKFKPFNMPTLSGKCLLGVSIANKLNKFELPNLVDSFDFAIQNSAIDQNSQISAVIVNVIGNNYNSLVWGSSELSNAYSCMIEDLEKQNILKANAFDVGDNTIFNSDFASSGANYRNLHSQNLDGVYNQNEYISKEATQEQTQQNPTQQDDVMFEDENEDILFDDPDNQKDSVLDDFDELRDETDEIVEEDDEYYNEKEIDEMIKASTIGLNSVKKSTDKTGYNFYELISEQVDKMLAENEPEQVLQEIIPDSTFVRIGNDDNTQNVFGVIYQNDRVKYICYGIYSHYGNQIDDKIATYYQWLPIDAENPYGEGYYMSYQDADTGENLEMQII